MRCVRFKRFQYWISNLILLILWGVGFTSFAGELVSSSLRVVTLAPNLTEIVDAVGAGPELVGVSEDSDLPELFKTLPRVSNFQKIYSEKILSLKPDLVLAWAGGNSQVELDQLRRFGVSVKEIKFNNILSIADAIEQVGVLTGHQKEGSDLAEAFRERYQKIKNQSQKNLPAKKVFLEISESPFYTPGRASFLTDILKLCGAESVFPNLKFEAAPVSLESIIAANPDVIIAFSPVDPKFWERWPEITAVKNGNIYQINADLLARPGPRILEGAAEVCDWVR
jgi:iron complex transport system substrate-binding protein